LDVSEEISIAINRDRSNDAALLIDMVPFMKETDLSTELTKRIGRGAAVEDLVVGILPNKFGPAFKDILHTKDAACVAKSLKARRFKVIGTRGWNEAEFTAGGVDVKEIDENSMESILRRGLFFAGEILDVNGRRGGYNLAWAWASGAAAADGAIRSCAG
jgi:predicted flavoprotein YhiN